MLKDVSVNWVAKHLPTHSEVIARNAHEPHEGCSGNLVVVKVDGNPDVRKAIAELISAAPDLLKACKETLGEMRAYNAESEFDESCPMKPTFDQLKAAIAKAEPQENPEPELCPHGFGFVEYCPDCNDKEIKAKWREKEDSHG